MRRYRTEIAIVAVGALLFVLLAYERTSIAEKERPSVYSTYDTGRSGYRALYEVLRAAGVPAERFERDITAIEPAVKTLVVTGYEEDPAAKPLDEHDAQALRSFVLDGGRFVAIDAEFAGANDITPGVGTTYRRPGRGDAAPLSRDAFTAGVARLRGTIEWYFPRAQPHRTPLFGNAKGVVAVWYRLGRGEVVAISAPELFGNAQLRNADNVRFAYNAIAGHGPVAFDEYVHGYDDSLTMWGVLPRPVRVAVWIVVAIAMVALIGANVPFAPPYLPKPDDERTSADYIAAVAELMRRARGRFPDSYELATARANYRERLTRRREYT